MTGTLTMSARSGRRSRSATFLSRFNFPAAVSNCLTAISLAGLHHVAVGGNDAALGIEIERAVAGVGERAVRHQDFEEAVALYREIERGAGRRQGALGHSPRRADGLDAQSQFDADRQDVALVRRLGADLAHVIVQQVLKLGALALVSGRTQVRDVVGDDLDGQRLGGHSGGGSVESEHGLILGWVTTWARRRAVGSRSCADRLGSGADWRSWRSCG